MAQIRISAKTLGELALTAFCPRCFWVRMRLGNRLPYQMFPGIFASIDSYSKKVTHVHWEQHDALPPWLREFGMSGRPVRAPHHSHFFVIDEETGIKLTGVPDEILRRPDGFFIVDYKTARFTPAQDSLLPLYEVQLNGYAHIGGRCGFEPVSGISLVYYEPQTDLSPGGLESVLRPDGFLMPFKAKLLPLRLQPEEMIPPLLRKARGILDCSSPPKGAEGCQNCRRLEELVGLLR